MESAKVCSVATLLSFLALIPRTDSHVFSHDDARSINGPAAESFVDSLFKEYGTDKSMSLKQFSSLMKELKIGFTTSEAKTKAGSGKENGVKNGLLEVRSPKMKRNQGWKGKALCFCPLNLCLKLI